MRKKCAWCGEVKPIEAFSPVGKQRRPECRPCREARRKSLRAGAPRVRPWGISLAMLAERRSG
jgi:hypothetical protein